MAHDTKLGKLRFQQPSMDWATNHPIALISWAPCWRFQATVDALAHAFENSIVPSIICSSCEHDVGQRVLHFVCWMCWRRLQYPATCAFSLQSAIRTIRARRQSRSAASNAQQESHTMLSPTRSIAPPIRLIPIRPQESHAGTRIPSVQFTDRIPA